MTGELQTPVGANQEKPSLSGDVLDGVNHLFCLRRVTVRRREEVETVGSHVVAKGCGEELHM